MYVFLFASTVCVALKILEYCKPLRKLQQSSEPCLHQTHISSGHVCRCCVTAVTHSLEIQHSLLQKHRANNSISEYTDTDLADFKLVAKKKFARFIQIHGYFCV